MSSPLGIIGIGLMGQALAECLRGAGFEVIGWDRDPARSLDAGSAEEVITRCQRVLVSLPDSLVVQEVLRPLPFRAGQIILDTTTGHPEHAASLGAELAEKGVSYLDATISGSSAQVLKKEVSVMTGGDEEAFRQCADIFAAFATHTLHTGPCGSGSQMKLVTNLVLGLNRAALAEGLAFAADLGLDPALTLKALTGSMAYSRIMDTKGTKMTQRDFTPQARLSQHLKDVRLMLSTSSKPLPLSEAHRQLLEKAEALGCGDLDNSAILRAYD
jgi:3-hydroxyisobutyrate dehydrogenase-like beta-hydroxyacid dehydrogenase